MKRIYLVKTSKVLPRGLEREKERDRKKQRDRKKERDRERERYKKRERAEENHNYRSRKTGERKLTFKNFFM